MEPLYQLVGSIVAPRPAAELIDALVLQVRRERASVLAKSAFGATFVRFNAGDLGLIALACQALRGAAPSPLRFGFAASVREGAAPTASDDPDISTRSLEQAQELAAVARSGQVLVSPQLAAALIEAGFVLQSRQIRRPGGRVVAACLVNLGPAQAGEPMPVAGPAARTDVRADARTEADADAANHAPAADPFALRTASPAALLQGAAGLDAVMQALVAQADAMAARQGELEARQQRLLDRLLVVEAFERRVEGLQAVIDGVEAALAEQLPRQAEIAGLRGQCDAVVTQLAEAQRRLAEVAELQLQFQPLADQLAAVEARRQGVDEVLARATAVTHMLGDIQLQLEQLDGQRVVIDQAGDRLARLEFTLQEAQNTLRALQRERDAAERIEQNLKVLRARGAAKIWPSLTPEPP